MAEKDSISIQIDGETLQFKLSASQKAQLKRATKKVAKDVPTPKAYGGMVMSCKTRGVKSAYPFVLSSSAALPSGAKPHATCSTSHRGRDFNRTELKCFITQLKEYAKQIWPSFR